MRKDMFTIIRKEFARFFGDKRMLITTVFLPGLMIYLIYSFMGEGMMNKFMTDDTYVAKAYVQNMPTALSPALAQLSAEWTEVSEADVEEVKSKLQKKEADVLIIFPKGFTAKTVEYDVKTGEPAPNVEIYYNSTESESAKIYSDLSGILDSYEASMANKFDINAGDGVFDLATKKDMTGKIFATMLPMLLMTFLYSGCIAVAPEAIAGEKERGTIATLLVTPMKRSSLALGKTISLSTIALLSGLSSFLGTMLSLPKLMGGEQEGMDASVYVVTDYLLLLGIILTTVLLLTSIISVISAFAKSIKEASTAVSPLIIVVMGISLTPMFGSDGVKNPGLFLIPLYNSVQCLHGIFSFTYEPLQMVITMIVNVLYAGLLTGLLAKLFNSEKIMFAK